VLAKQAFYHLSHTLASALEFCLIFQLTVSSYKDENLRYWEGITLKRKTNNETNLEG
jgi:hypothetical protein